MTAEASSQEVIAKALRVVSAIHKHLAEQPKCRHELSEIMETALQD